MITGCRYSGDDNHLLQEIQSKCYSPTVAAMVNEAQVRYVTSCRLLNIETTLLRDMYEHSTIHYSFAEHYKGLDFNDWKSLEPYPIRGFDHRTIQDCHDIIACQFRFAHDFAIQDLLTPLVMADPKTEISLAYTWTEWSTKEIRRLVSIDQFLLNLLKSVTYQNLDAGYEGERALKVILSEEYAELRLAVGNSYWFV